MSVTPIRPDVELTLTTQDGHNEALDILHKIRIGRIRQTNDSRVSNIRDLYEAMSYCQYNWVSNDKKSVKIEVACDMSSDVTIPHLKSEIMRSFYFAVTLGRIFETNALHKYLHMLRGEYSLDQLITDYSLAFADTLLTELG